MSKANVGDRVKIIEAAEDLPDPEYHYSGQRGTVLRFLGSYIFVSPDDPLSGADKESGVPFFESEIEIVKSGGYMLKKEEGYLEQGYQICWACKEQPLELSDRAPAQCGTALFSEEVADEEVERLNAAYPNLVHFKQWNSKRLENV